MLALRGCLTVCHHSTYVALLSKWPYHWLLCVLCAGDPSTIKLIDFGLSKHFRERERMHQAVGSTYYVAPEVLLLYTNIQCDVTAT
jgi:serine/threonine protein kinase